MREKGTCDIHDAEQIDVELFLDFLRSNCLEDAVKSEAGIIDQGVYSTEALNSTFDGLCNARAILDVETRDEHVGIVGEIVGASDVPHRRHNVPSVMRKNLRGRAAKPG